MSQRWSMSVRMFACVVAILALFGAKVAVAQSLTDPQGDFDGDGQPNFMDADDDNDGVTDENDAYPFDPSRWERAANPTSAPPTAPPPPPAATAPPPAATSPPTLPTVPTVPMPTIPAPDTEQQEPPGNLTESEGPTPSVIDESVDSDGDGIANSHDPDDDNDGVTDDKDCAPFDPSVTVCSDSDLESNVQPTLAASSGGRDEATLATGGSGVLGSLYVTTLPVTGDGSGWSETAMLWLLASLAGGCAGAAALLRQRVR